MLHHYMLVVQYLPAQLMIPDKALTDLGLSTFSMTGVRLPWQDQRITTDDIVKSIRTYQIEMLEGKDGK